MSDILVSVVIPVLNGLDFLLKNLSENIRHFDKELPGRYEIIISDDSSEEDIEASVLALGCPQIKYILHPPPRGFGSNVNFGAQFATGKYLFMLNSDILLNDNFFDGLLRKIHQPNVFAVVPKINRIQGNFVESLTSGRYAQNKINLEFKNKSKLDESIDHPVYWACGAAMLCRRDLFNSLNGFSSLYEPAYSEDVDLSLRAWRSGFEVWYVGRSVANHAHNSTTKNVFNRRYLRYLQYRNHLLLNYFHLPLDFHGKFTIGAVKDFLLKPKLFKLAAILMAKVRMVNCGDKYRYSLEQVDEAIHNLRKSNE
jgi:GT2 family glycosyltransferase